MAVTAPSAASNSLFKNRDCLRTMTNRMNTWLGRTLYQVNGPWQPLQLRHAVIQWLVVGLVGAILGLSVLLLPMFPPQWAVLIILALLAPFAMLIAGNVQRLLLAVIAIEIPIQLDKYFFFQEPLANLGSIGGLNISVTTVCLVVLYALWLARLLVKSVRPQPNLLRDSLPLLAYLGAASLSLFAAQDLPLASFEIFLLLQAFLLYVYVIHAVRTRDDVKFLVAMLLSGLVIEGLIMIGARVVGHGLYIANITVRIDTDGRVGGTIGSPNGAAAYLLILLTPALSLLLTGLSKQYKSLALLAFGLGVGALVTTLSRGGWTGFAVSLALFYLVLLVRGRLSPSIALITLVAVLSIGLFFQGAISDRLFGNDNGSAYARVPLMHIAFSMIEDHPWLGVGANNFALAMKPYLTPTFDNQWIYTVHNKYLLVWSETGPLALLAFLSFLLITLWRGWQCWRHQDNFLSPLALAFATAIVGVMIHMNVDIFRGRPLMQSLCLVAGLLTAMHNIVAREKDVVQRQGMDQPILVINERSGVITRL